MAEQSFPVDSPVASICPWCSTRVTPETAVCPSCKAILLSGDEPDLPGVTAIDPSVGKVEKKAPGRNRILSWISGDYPEDTSTRASAGALQPPDLEVQREILRLELEAEVANLQAEADALLAEAAVEGRELPAAIRNFASSADLSASTDAEESPHQVAGDEPDEREPDAGDRTAALDSAIDVAAADAATDPGDPGPDALRPPRATSPSSPEETAPPV